jgi:hypothetical protein
MTPSRLLHEFQDGLHSDRFCSPSSGVVLTTGGQRLAGRDDLPHAASSVFGKEAIHGTRN